MYSGGPCYLHSRLTSSDVFTWEMCNATLWFTEEDNLCFRQGEAATARGVGFPSLLFTERGRFLLRSARLQSPCYMSSDRICWQPNGQLAYTLGLSLPLSQFPSSLSLGFVPGSLTLYLIPPVYIPSFTLHLLFPPSCFLSFAISPSVRGLMWDCKWRSLTSISG